MVCGVLGQKSKGRHQLAQSHFGTQLPNLRKRLEHRVRLHGVHGNKSPILGSDAWALRSRPITSTRTSCPGDSLAIRAARVTPLVMSNTPSEHSNTQIGGIPTADAPNRAI